MKTTEANEDRRISDITKRISQLSHTIYEMNAFLSENSYQKAVLSQRFEREFDSIREHHDTIIHDIITSLHTKKSDLSDDIEQLFSNRLNEMSHDFEEFKHKLSSDVKESEQLQAVLEQEVASLFIPAERSQNCIIKINHLGNREFYINHMDAPREFLLKVIETICGGGIYHEEQRL